MAIPENEIKDEVALMQQFRAGSTDAFTIVYKQLYRRVFWFARKFLDDPEDARDLTAEAFIQVWNQKQVFKNLDAVEAFLHVTVRNKCFNLLKHQQMKAEKHQELHRQLQERAEGDFSEELIQIQLVGKIYAEVNKLPPRMRDVFLLSYRDGLRPAEIAELLQIKPQTVINQRITAVKALQLALGKDFVISALFLAECRNLF